MPSNIYFCYLFIYRIGEQNFYFFFKSLRLFLYIDIEFSTNVSYCIYASSFFIKKDTFLHKLLIHLLIHKQYSLSYISKKLSISLNFYSEHVSQTFARLQNLIFYPKAFVLYLIFSLPPLTSSRCFQNIFLVSWIPHFIYGTLGNILLFTSGVNYLPPLFCYRWIGNQTISVYFILDFGYKKS